MSKIYRGKSKKPKITSEDEPVIILDETYSYVRKVTRYFDNSEKSYTYFDKTNKIYQDLDTLHKDYYAMSHGLPISETEVLWFRTSEPNKLYKLRPQEIPDIEERNPNERGGLTNNFFQQANAWQNSLLRNNVNNSTLFREALTIGAGGGGGSGNAGVGGGGGSGGLLRFLPDDAQPVQSSPDEIVLSTSTERADNVITNVTPELLIEINRDNLRASLNDIAASIMRNTTRNILES
jgi:hypothetical protein